MASSTLVAKPAISFTLNYIARHSIDIATTAQKLGIPAAAIASVIGEEMGNVYSEVPSEEGPLTAKSFFDSALDNRVLNSFTSADIAADFVSRQSDIIAGATPSGTIATIAQKFSSPTAADLGPANINLGTAILLLQQYLAANPSDPLGLQKYADDYHQLAADLIDLNSPTTVTFAGLVLQRGIADLTAVYGDQFTQLNDPNSSSYNPAAYAAYLDTFYKQGQGKFESNHADVFNGDTSINPNTPNVLLPPDQGDGGSTVLRNFNAFQDAADGDPRSAPADPADTPASGIQTATADDNGVTILGDSTASGNWFARYDFSSNQITIGTSGLGSIGVFSIDSVQGINTSQANSLVLAVDLDPSQVDAVRLDPATGVLSVAINQQSIVTFAPGSHIATTGSGLSITWPDSANGQTQIAFDASTGGTVLTQSMTTQIASTDTTVIPPLTTATETVAADGTITYTIDSGNPTDSVFANKTFASQAALDAFKIANGVTFGVANSGAVAALSTVTGDDLQSFLGQFAPGSLPALPANIVSATKLSNGQTVFTTDDGQVSSAPTQGPVNNSDLLKILQANTTMSDAIRQDQLLMNFSYNAGAILAPDGTPATSSAEFLPTNLSGKPLNLLQTIGDDANGIRIDFLQDPDTGKIYVVPRGTANAQNEATDLSLAGDPFSGPSVERATEAVVQYLSDGNQVEIVGHSLGGNLSTRIAVGAIDVVNADQSSEVDVNNQLSLRAYNGAGLPNITDAQVAELAPITQSYRIIVPNQDAILPGGLHPGDIVSALFPQVNLNEVPTTASFTGQFDLHANAQFWNADYSAIAAPQLAVTPGLGADPIATKLAVNMTNLLGNNSAVDSLTALAVTAQDFGLSLRNAAQQPDGADLAQVQTVSAAVGRNGLAVEAAAPADQPSTLASRLNHAVAQGASAFADDLAVAGADRVAAVEAGATIYGAATVVREAIAASNTIQDLAANAVTTAQSVFDLATNALGQAAITEIANDAAQAEAARQMMGGVVQFFGDGFVAYDQAVINEQQANDAFGKTVTDFIGTAASNAKNFINNQIQHMLDEWGIDPNGDAGTAPSVLPSPVQTALANALAPLTGYAQTLFGTVDGAPGILPSAGAFGLISSAMAAENPNASVQTLPDGTAIFAGTATDGSPDALVIQPDSNAAGDAGSKQAFFSSQDGQTTVDIQDLTDHGSVIAPAIGLALGGLAGVFTSIDGMQLGAAAGSALDQLGLNVLNFLRDNFSGLSASQLVPLLGSVSAQSSASSGPVTVTTTGNDGSPVTVTLTPAASAGAAIGWSIAVNPVSGPALTFAGTLAPDGTVGSLSVNGESVPNVADLARFGFTPAGLLQVYAGNNATALGNLVDQLSGPPPGPEDLPLPTISNISLTPDGGFTFTSSKTEPLPLADTTTVKVLPNQQGVVLDPDAGDNAKFIEPPAGTPAVFVIGANGGQGVPSTFLVPDEGGSGPSIGALAETGRIAGDTTASALSSQAMEAGADTLAGALEKAGPIAGAFITFLAAQAEGKSTEEAGAEAGGVLAGGLAGAAAGTEIGAGFGQPGLGVLIGGIFGAIAGEKAVSSVFAGPTIVRTADGEYLELIPPPPGSAQALIGAEPDFVKVDPSTLPHTSDGSIILQDRIVAPSGVQFLNNGQILDGSNRQIGQITVGEPAEDGSRSITFGLTDANGAPIGLPQTQTVAPDPATGHVGIKFVNGGTTITGATEPDGATDTTVTKTTSAGTVTEDVVTRPDGTETVSASATDANGDPVATPVKIDLAPDGSFTDVNGLALPASVTAELAQFGLDNPVRSGITVLGGAQGQFSLPDDAEGDSASADTGPQQGTSNIQFTDDSNGAPVAVTFVGFTPFDARAAATLVNVDGTLAFSQVTDTVTTSGGLRFISTIANPGTAAQAPTAAQAQDANGATFAGGFAGSVAGAIGDQIAHLIAGNNVPLSLVLQAVSGTIATQLTNAINSVNAPSDGGIGAEFITNFTGAVGSFLGGQAGAALAKALGVSPQIGSLAGGVLGGAVAKQLTAIVAKDVFGVTDGFGLVGGQVPDFLGSLESAGAGAVGTFLGAELANVLDLGGNPVDAQIGSQVGGAIGAFVGQALIPIPVIGALVGSFIGSFIGDIFGGIFGDDDSPPPPDPHSFATASLIETDRFAVTSNGTKDGADPQAGIGLAKAIADQVNNILDAVGGRIANILTPPSISVDVGANDNITVDGVQVSGPSVGRLFGALVNSLPSLPGVATASGALDTSTQDNAAQAAFDFGTLTALRQMQIEGGDIFLKRALYASDATTVSQLLADLQVAADYESFAQNPQLFEMALVTSPDPSVGEKWAGELARAQQLGLVGLTADNFNFSRSADIAAFKANPPPTGAGLGALFGSAPQFGAAFGAFVRSPFLNFFGLFGRSEIDGTTLVAASAAPSFPFFGGTGDHIPALLQLTGSGLFGLGDAGAAGQFAAALDIDGTADTLIATDGGDLLRVHGNANILLGGSGADVLSATGIANTLIAGAGSDTLSTSGSGNVLIAGSGNDAATASGNDNTLIAGTGTAVLSAIGTGETLLGGAGSARLMATGDRNVLTAGSGSDVLTAIGSSDLLQGGAGTAILIATGDNNQLSAGTGAATLIATGSSAVLLGGDSASTLIATGDNDILQAGTGDAVLVGHGDHGELLAGAGHDTLSAIGSFDALSGNTGNATIIATGNNDLLVAGTGDASLLATGDDNLLIAGSGRNFLSASGTGAQLATGGGAAVLIAAGTGNVFVERGGNNTLINSGGTAAVDFSHAPRGVTVNLARGLATNGFGGLDTLSGIETVVGSAFADTLVGDAGNDTFAGGGGANLIIGGSGVTTAGYWTSQAPVIVDLGVGLALNGFNAVDRLIDVQNVIGSAAGGDTLLGGANNVLEAIAGGDTLLPGSGFNTLIGSGTGLTTADYAREPGPVVVNLGAGIALNAYGGTDHLLGINRVIGSSVGDNTLIGGGSGKDVLVASGGSGDLLEGGSAVTTLVSGVGANTLIAGTGIAVAVYAGSGIIVNLAADAAITSSGSDTLIGITAALVVGTGNTLIGGFGTDTLDVAGSGNTLIGGAGNASFGAGGGGNTLIGGAGVNTADYSAASSGVTVNLSAGMAQIGSTAQDTLSNIEDVIGSAFNDVLIGSAAGGNVLAAGAGNDTLVGTGAANTLQGGSGNDTLVASGTGNTLKAGSGADTLVSSGGSNTLIAGGGVAVAAYSGTGLVADLSAHTVRNGTGTDLLVGIADVQVSGSGNTLLGGPGPSTLAAQGSNNVLIGGSGRSALASSGGSNTLIGGSGGGFAAYSGSGIVVDLGAETVANGTGTDTLVNLAAAQVSGTANTLLGGSGISTLVAAGTANLLVGGSGITTLGSGGGANTLIAGTGQTVAYYAGTGLVVDLSAGTATNGGGTDQLVGIGDVLVTGSGDTLIGDAVNDILTAAGNSDTLFAGAGIDTLSASGDHNLLAGSVGKAVMSAVGNVNTLRAGEGPATLSATGIANTLIGGSGDDLLSANGTGNTLIGGSGTDTLLSAGGANTLIGGSGSTVAVYADAAGPVVVNLIAGIALNGTATDALIGIDDVAVVGNANLLLAGDGPATLSASGNANTLLGGTGSDTLIAIGTGNTLIGGAGTNTLVSGGGSNTLIAGSGLTTADYIVGAAPVVVDLAAQTVANGIGVDTLIGIEAVAVSGAGSTLLGDAGADVLSAAGNGDTLIAGIGADTLTASGDGNTLVAAAGTDQLSATGNDNLLIGGAGAAIVAASGAANTLLAGTGSATLGATDGTGNVLIGGSGADIVVVVADANTLIAGTGANTLFATGSSNTLIAGSGTDILAADGSGNVLLGSSGVATLLASGGGNTLFAGSGRDIAQVDGNGNLLADGDGTAVLIADGNSNTLAGGTGLDTLIVSGSGNLLVGRRGTSTLISTGGANTLFGGPGVALAAYAGTGLSVDLGAGTATNGAGTDTLVNIRDAAITGNANTLIAGATDDTLTAFGSGNTLLGGSGTATLIAAAAGNLLEGGAGTTTLIATGGSNTLLGGSGLTVADYAGAMGPLTVNLAAGTAQSGSAGADTLSGIGTVIGSKQGNNLLIGGVAGGDVLSGGAGNDTIIGTGAGNTLLAGSGSATLIATGTGNVLAAGGGVDTLLSSGGSNTLLAGSGLAMAAYAGTGLAVNLGAGTATNGVGTDTLAGIADVVVSGSGNIVSGGLAVDTLTALGTGNTLLGGAGNDTFIALSGGNTLLGGSGRATADYAAAASGVTVNLAAGTAQIGSAAADVLSNIADVIGSAFNDVLIGGAAGGNILAGGAGNDTLIGTGIANTLIAGSGNDTLEASGGSGNVLEAGSGVDTLLSSGGSNTLIGGTGLAVATYVGSGLVVDLAADTATNGTGIDQLVNVTVAEVVGNNSTLLGGPGTDTLIADGAGNTLVGGAGHSTLISEGGANTLLYGTGVSVATFSNAVVNLAAGVVTHAGGAVDVVVGIHNVIADGNANVLMADQANDQLAVAGNTSTILGGTGNDTLSAIGSGDTLLGGSGATTLASNAGGNTLEAGSGLATAYYGGSAVTVNLATGAAAVNGSGVSDQLLGIAAAVAGGASDTLIGGSNDTLAAAGSGDTLTVSGSGNLLRSDSGNNTLLASGGGNTLLGGSGSDVLSATAAGNTLIGGSGHSTLMGTLAGDTLEGGGGRTEALYAGTALTINLSAGTAKATGGSASDTLLGITDVVVSGGSDTLTAASGDTLEELGGSGSTLIASGSGNLLKSDSGNNTLIASASGNTLLGGSGSDVLGATSGGNTLLGGSGATTLLGNAAGNMLVAGARTEAFYAASALAVSLSTGIAKANGATAGDTLLGTTDVVVTGSSDTLIAASGDTLEVTGSGNTLMAGGSGDLLQSDSGTNTLIASGSGDTLSALAGFSTLVSNAAGNTLRGGAGTAVAFYAGSALTVNLGAGTAKANSGSASDVLVGITAVTAAGSSDTLIAAGGDTLTAASGSGNTLVAAGGGNTLLGGSGTTTLVGNAGGNTLKAGAGLTVAYYAGSGLAINLSTGKVQGASGSDTLLGITDVVLSGSNDTLIAASGDTLEVTSGSGDTLIASGSGNILKSDSGANTLIASGNGNTLLGGTGRDTLAATGSGNTLVGGAGFSTLQSNAGGNTLMAGIGRTMASYAASGLAVNLASGKAQVNGGTASDVLVGITDMLVSGGSDTLVGSSNETLEVAGGAGNTLLASGNNDALRADSGTNTLIASGIGNTLMAGTGTDTLAATGTGNTLLGGSGTATLSSDAGGNTLEAGSGKVAAFYAGSHITVNLGTATATASGSSVSDKLFGITDAMTGGASDTLIASTGDTLEAVSGSGNLLMATGSGNLLKSDSGANTLLASAGGNTLLGGSGTDTLVAAVSGNSLLGGSGTTTLVSNAGGNTLKSGAGTVAYYGSSGLTVNLSTGTAGVNGSSVSDVLIGIVDALVAGSSDTLIGSSNDLLEVASGSGDTLIATGSKSILKSDSGSNTLIGASGDTLIAAGGNDLMIAASGDTLLGSSGIDTASYANSSAAVVVNLSTGSGSGGSAQGDVLAGISMVVGSAFNDTLTGNGAGSTLLGGAGNNTLVNGTADYALAPKGVVVNLAAGTAQNGYGGTDTLSSVSNAIGSAQADTLLGDGGTDTLDGNGASGGGTDTLVSGAGHDSFVFGRGYGFASVFNDIEQVGTKTTTSSTVFTTTTTTTVQGGKGSSQVTTTVTTTNTSTFSVTTTTTTHLDGGTDTLTFKPGVAVSDVMAQASGNNLVVAIDNPQNPALTFSQLTDKATLINFFNPLDVIQTFAFADGTTINVANMAFQTGGAGSNTLVGTAASNWLNAGPGGGTLIGGSGNDVLIGGAGLTTLIGGGGNNLLFGGSGGTVASYTGAANPVAVNLATGRAQNGAGGTDTLTNIHDVVASANATLTAGAGIDTLVAAGSKSTLIGGTGTSTLLASGSSDTLVAGTGTTTLMNSGAQSFYQYAGQGQDTIVNGSSANSGPTNELDFTGSLTHEGLWFVQSGNDLQIDVVGTKNRITVASWFSSASNALSEITATDGLKIDAQLSQLVQAMATYAANNPGFDPTAPIIAQAPNDPTLQAAIASAWHH